MAKLIRNKQPQLNYYVTGIKKKSFKAKFLDSKYLLLLLSPCVIYFVVFHYLPLWGIFISIQDYSPFKGFWDSEWVGFKHFQTFFSNPNFFRLVKNTFLLSLYNLIWGFPAPIIFALVLNEVSSLKFKKLVQTVSYMPHFISTVVVVGMVTMFLSPSTGIVNIWFEGLGLDRVNFLSEAKYFRTIYIASDVWQSMGWGAIIYIAALTNIDPALYEAAIIDGANNLKRIIYITLPCIAPTIITLLLLRTGHLLSVGFEKVYLMQKPITYAASDVINTYIFRQGLISGNFSYASAVGLFNSLVNLFFLFTANFLARRYSDSSLW